MPSADFNKSVHPLPSSQSQTFQWSVDVARRYWRARRQKMQREQRAAIIRRLSPQLRDDLGVTDQCWIKHKYE